MITENQELYAQSIVRGLSPQAAANAAGLDSPPALSPALKQRVSQLKQEMQENCGIKKEDVVKGFLSAIDLAETSTEMIQGWREVGKMLGYYAPEQKEITITTGAIGHLSNEKLLELADMTDVIDSEYHLVDTDG